MKKNERVISLLLLWVIGLSNVTTPVVYAAQVETVAPPQSSNEQTNTLAPHQAFAIDKGSVLGASTSLLTVGSQNLDTSMGIGGSAYKRIPIQVEQLAKKVYKTDENVTLAVTNPDNEAFTTTVADDTGKAVPVEMTESNNGTTSTVQLVPSDTLKPGKYTVTVTDQEGKTTTQDFTWGVLALNTDKSMYHPGETADIAMAVLNDKGDMVCDAKVELVISNPSTSSGQGQGLGTRDLLSTDNGKITINPQCQKHDFSLQPDYEAHYTFGGAGNYQFTLSATTQNGTHTISDTIQVKEQIPFDVQRVSATRLYPPNTYPMTFHIKANRDFTGTVTETVPDSFTITPATQSASQSYTNMQTVYLNSQDPTQQLQQTLLNAGDMLAMPFQGNYPITQGFGVQLTDPLLQSFYSHYGLAGHDGVDFGVPMHTPLYAVDEGDIVWSGPGDYGVTVVIQHSWGKSYYGHLSNTSVTLGQHVTKGQLIGYSGESGEATGPHLHFGMKPNNPDMTNGYYGKIDPLPYLPYGHAAQAMVITKPTLALARNTAVLGASDSATASSAASVATATPTPTAALSPTSVPTVTPTVASAPSVSSTVTPSSLTPTPAPSLGSMPVATPAANTNFTVLEKAIQTNEQLAANAQTQKVKVITWHVSLKKGESTSLGYAYQTPKVSPEFYLLGPVKFYESGSDKVVFQEQRQWQLANDDVGVEWYQNTTGHPWNGYSWQYRKKITIDHTKVGGSSNTPLLDGTGFNYNNNSGNSTTWTQTIGSESNMVLVVAVETYYGYTVKSVTYTVGGTQRSLTKLAAGNDGTSQANEIWYVTNPVAGSASFTATLNQAAPSPLVAGSATFYNVNTSNPFGTTQNAYGSGTPASHAFTTTANQVLFDSFSYQALTGDWAPATGQTQLWVNGSYNGGTASYKTATTTSTTMTWTLSGSTEHWDDFAVPINPVSATNTVTFDTSIGTDSAGTYDSYTCSCTTKSFSYTIGSESSRALIVSVIYQAGSVSTVKYGSQSLSQIGTLTMSNGEILDMWGGLIPSNITGANSIAFTFSTSQSSVGVGAVSYYNVSSIGTGHTASGASGTISNTITSNTSQLIVDMAKWESGPNDGTVGASQTMRWDQTNWGAFEGSDQAGQSSSTTMTWTASANTGWYDIAVALNPTTPSSYNTVTFDNKSIGTATIASSVSWNHTVGVQSNRILIVGLEEQISSGSMPTVSGVTYGSLNLTKLSGSTVQGATSGYTTHGEVWYLLDPPSGTATVKVTLSASANGGVDGAAVSYYNVDPTNPFGTVATNSNSSANTANVTNTVSSNSTTQRVYEFLFDNGYARYAVNAGQTLREYDLTYAGFYAADVAAGASNTSLSWTNSGSADYWVDIGVALNPTSTSALYNFPVLVNIPSDSDLAANAQSSGNDILFTDATGRNLLDFETESFNKTTGSLQAWVKIPSLSSSVDTIIYMYYGNPAATSQANATAVWDSNYIGVWHMADNAANTTVTDSTGNGNNGTAQQNTSGMHTSSGKIDGALSYNGTSDYDTLGNGTSIKGQSQVTISAWVNTSVLNSAKHDIYFESTSTGAGTSRFCLDLSSTNIFDLQGRSTDTNSLTTFVQNTTALSTGTWYYVVGVYDSTTGIHHLMVNGSDQTNTVSGTAFDTTNPLLIAHGKQNTASSLWDGILDEVRISSIYRSINWSTTEYNNQSSPSTFETLGSVETDIYAPTLSQLMRHGKWFDSTGKEQPFTF